MKNKYDSSNRKSTQALNKQKVLQNYIKLLTEANGQEVSLEELAAYSNISARTIFRFFGNKKSLETEIDVMLSNYMTNISKNLNAMNFVDFVEHCYNEFDELESLFTAYLATGFGQKSRTLLKKKFSLLVKEKLVLELGLTKLKLKKSEKQKLDLIVTLINVGLWKDLKEVYAISGKEQGLLLKWATSTLIQDVKGSTE